jgi:hypothetical protein
MIEGLCDKRQTFEEAFALLALRWNNGISFLEPLLYILDAESRATIYGWPVVFGFRCAIFSHGGRVKNYVKMPARPVCSAVLS